MAYKFNCPHCNQSLEADKDLYGESINCPSCNEVCFVPIQDDYLKWENSKIPLQARIHTPPTDKLEPIRESIKSPLCTATINTEGETACVEKKASQWWRWLILPFGVCFGSVLGTVFAGLLHWFGLKLVGGFSKDGWYYLYIMPIIGNLIFGYLWGYLSCNLAPSSKVIAATIMTTILGCILIVLVFFSVVILHSSAGENTQMILGCLAAMGAAIYTIVHFAEDTNNC